MLCYCGDHWHPLFICFAIAKLSCFTYVGCRNKFSINVYCFFISFLGNHRVIWLQKLIIIPLLLFLLVLIFLSINHPDAATSSVTYWPKHFDTGLITQGMILAFFAFGGWESFASMTGEIKKPARTVPFVIFVDCRLVCWTFYCDSKNIFREKYDDGKFFFIRSCTSEPFRTI
ncbi:hypothetical protein DA717_07815 [Piscirickettsiaceae bacterium NZ-RLO2]|nr:hypothetical protein DA717_07815 [Piscirickettsiaceae bacterium NZ-RLO2]